MDHAEKLSITLPANLARLVRDKVKTGAYASNSEVIRDALRAWQEKSDRGTRLEEIKREIAEAIADPSPRIPAKEVFDEIRARYREMTGASKAGSKGRRRA